MANIQGTYTMVRGGKITYKWQTLNQTDTQGIGMRIPGPDKTLTLRGTASTETFLAEGSNNSTNGVDGSWATLHDAAGNAISLAAPSVPQTLVIAENTEWIRPRVTSPTGTTALIAEISTPNR